MSMINFSELDLKNAPALVGGKAASPVPKSKYCKPDNCVFKKLADLCKVMGCVQLKELTTA